METGEKVAGARCNMRDAAYHVSQQDSRIGSVVFCSCRHLFSCDDVLESEILAVKEGLMLASQWSSLPIDIESDCVQAVKMVQRVQNKIQEHIHRTKPADMCTYQSTIWRTDTRDWQDATHADPLGLQVKRH